MNNKSTIGFVVIVLIVIIGGLWLLNGNKAVAPADGVQPIVDNEGQVGTEESATGETADQAAAKTFDVTGVPFAFDLKEIRVKQGDRVRIHFTSKEGFHDWVVDEFDARTKQLKVNEEDTIEFIANTTGTFEYYCSVGNHRAMGMVGKLIVE
ncbi:MAG: Plastocyanin [Parcubacteria group bacterium GW2011_GWA2_47_8]|nr:MAG: Plastocyanin [Parcubacteria group bacterium GW2011_GWA2_47_8]